MTEYFLTLGFFWVDVIVLTCLSCYLYWIH